MLKIRLSRFGKKKKPTYRLVVSEHTKDTLGDALEYLGHYDPHTKVIEVKKDRILYWISKGAQPSPTVHNLLIDQNVIEGDKVKASKAKKKKKEEKNETEPVAKLDGEKPAEESKEEEPKVKEKPAEPAKEEKKDEPKKDKPKVEEKPAEKSKKEEAKQDPSASSGQGEKKE